MKALPIIMLSLLLSNVAYAEPDDVITLLIENDVFTGTDRDYTSGVLLSYVSGLNTGPKGVDRLGRRLPFIDPDTDLHVSFSIGHELYTPEDISVEELIEDDRPYAAHLYADFGLTTHNPRRLNTWRLSLGIVGPSARGEEIQSGIHEKIDSQDPRGWDNQLDDEFVYALQYETKWRKFFNSETFGLSVDVLPHLGLAAGNLNTFVNTGLTLRLGQGLDSDYGPPRIRPAIPGSLYYKKTDRRFNWYFFLGADGRYVVHNIFLDGNTDKDSHSVDKRNWVADAQAGIVMNMSNMRITYSYVVRTREFELQNRHSRFGSLSFSLRF